MPELLLFQLLSKHLNQVLDSKCIITCFQMGYLIIKIKYLLHKIKNKLMFNILEFSKKLLLKL